MQWLFGIPHTLQLDAIIITCWIILNTIASLAVYKRGTSRQSDVRSCLTS
ncbi:hypothetical protein ACLK1T_07550 [Escherichia coli]